ncbi:peptidase M48 Ste24p [Streptomyces violaceusniger Tu 4113]|uniref:Peptidase M48 Ste24p n=1 Tax=Streptomyces violaceusniger (strain Tu 4113) TaxID=653045 RepID=G2P2G1_STRV4|nr:peptidase M48 Ste24p [Streptomyces violaceusniger Tu 4113]
MTAVLFVPLILPFLAPAPARRTLDRLAPATALWILAASALALAGTCVAALRALVLTGLLKLPAFAALGELIHPLRTPSDFVVVPAASAATGVLALGVMTLVRSAFRQTRAYRAARTQAGRRPDAGDLCVVDSPHPDAYALPGRPHRIVVTTAMLRSLGPAEREALFAHERAHNRGAGHHYFLAAAELAAHCHPALRRVREIIRLAAERDADEAAATAVGDRRLIATAIARAALAGHASPTTRPDFAPAATTGPVPQRVAALLGPAVRRPRPSAAGSPGRDRRSRAPAGAGPAGPASPAPHPALRGGRPPAHPVLRRPPAPPPTARTWSTARSGPSARRTPEHRARHGRGTVRSGPTTPAATTAEPATTQGTAGSRVVPRYHADGVVQAPGTTGSAGAALSVAGEASEATDARAPQGEHG